MVSTINKMIEILESHGGNCTIKQLFKEIQLFDEYINQSEIDRVIRDYPQIFKRTPEVKTRDGRKNIEEGIALADGLQ